MPRIHSTASAICSLGSIDSQLGRTWSAASLTFTALGVYQSIRRDVTSQPFTMVFREMVSRIRGDKATGSPQLASTSVLPEDSEPAIDRPAQKKPAAFLLHPEEESRLRAVRFRTGETIYGSVYDNRAAAEEKRSVVLLVAKLECVTKTIRRITTSDTYPSSLIDIGGILWATRSDYTKTKKWGFRGIACAEHVLFDARMEQGGDLGRHTRPGQHHSICLPIPKNADTVALLPSLDVYK